MRKDIDHQYHPLREFDTLLGIHIAKLKVSWRISDDGYIGGFARFGGKRGNGAIAMQQICHLADKYRLPLHLNAAAEELVAYYQQFDFVMQAPNPKRVPRYMMREPHQYTYPDWRADRKAIMEYRKGFNPLFSTAFYEAAWDRRRREEARK